MLFSPLQQTSHNPMAYFTKISLSLTRTAVSLLNINLKKTAHNKEFLSTTVKTWIGFLKCAVFMQG